MSFRQFGGLNYAARHNIVSSNYNTSNNLLVTQNVGQPNSYINYQSDISGNININGNLDVTGNLDISVIQANTVYTPSYPGAYLVTEYTASSITSFIQLPIFASIPSYFSFYNSYYTGSTSGTTQVLTPNNFTGIHTSSTGGGSINYFSTSLNINDNNAYYLVNPGYQLTFYQNVNFNYGKTSGQTATISNLSNIPVTCKPSVGATSAVELYYWNGSSWILIPAPTTATG